MSRLIGAPPGYVGFDQGGLLTDGIDQHPHCVLLLDEIEKAHPDLYNILLQVMDHGKLTDHNGKQISFRNVILIMTTNAGASDAQSPALAEHRGAFAPLRRGRGNDLRHVGRIVEYRDRNSAVDVMVRARGRAEPMALPVEAVLNCSGSESDYRKLESPLVRELLEQNRASPDPLTLGLRVAADGALVDAGGLDPVPDGSGSAHAAGRHL